MKFGIAKKLICLCTLSVIILGMILGFYFIRYEKESLLLELDERAKALLGSLATSCEYPVLIKNQKALSKIAEGVLNQRDTIFCEIIDKEGQILFQGGTKEEKYIQEYTSSIMTEKFTEETGEELILDARESGTEEIGKIYLTLSLDGLNKKLSNVKKTVFLIVVIVTVFISILIVLLIRLVLGRPIDKLLAGTKMIGRGDLSYRVKLKTRDEIGELANSFNKMTEDLSKTTVSKDYVDNIIKSMIDTLIVLDPDAIIKTVNQATLDLLEYKGEEILGQPLGILFAEEGEYTVFKGTRWEKLLKEGSVRDYDITYRTKLGEKIPVSFSGSVMRKSQMVTDKDADKRGEIVGMVGIARDMREIKQLQRQLIQSDKMAAVGQLAGGVAHEINNPMGVILGFAQSIAKITKEDDPLYKPLKAIEREAIRCKNLVSDLLTFSKTERVHPEITDINKTIDETLSLIEAQAKVKDVKIIKYYGTDLPRVVTNKNQIQQVIINLCNNAIDAMHSGGRITISTDVSAAHKPATGVESREQRGSANNVVARLPRSVNEIKDDALSLQYLEIIVSDTGQGMTEEVKKHIFEPFFTTKEVGKGTGLGLSLCYETIQKHNGTIEVESEVGKGTTFIIKLPI